MYQMEKLISELTEQSGLALEFDEQNSCSLLYNDFIITLQFRLDSNDIVLFTTLTNPDEFSDLNKDVMYRALSLSYNGEGTYENHLGLFQDNLILTKIINNTNISADELGNYILKFSEQAVSIKDSLISNLDN